MYFLVSHLSFPAAALMAGKTHAFSFCPTTVVSPPGRWIRKRRKYRHIVNYNNSRPPRSVGRRDTARLRSASLRGARNLQLVSCGRSILNTAQQQNEIYERILVVLFHAASKRSTSSLLKGTGRPGLETFQPLQRNTKKTKKNERGGVGTIHTYGPRSVTLTDETHHWSSTRKSARPRVEAKTLPPRSSIPTATTASPSHRYDVFVTYMPHVFTAVVPGVSRNQ